MLDRIKAGPLLSVHEVRRAVAVYPKTNSTYVSQLGAEDARWVGDTTYTQISDGKLVERKVRADLFAIGSDFEFTQDRGVEATITSLDTRHPFTLRYSVHETPSGISYTLRRLKGRKIDRTFEFPVGSDFRLRNMRAEPAESITREDIELSDKDQHALLLSESFTDGILKASGVEQQTPVRKS